MGILLNVRKFLADRRRRRFVTHYRDAVSNIRFRLQDQASSETTQYVIDNMARLQSVDTWRKVHDHAISCAALDGGLVLEFGVFSGTTSRYICAKTGWKIDGFDSFEGLPEDWRDGFDKGTFKVAKPPNLGPNIALHVGWFEDTLPLFLKTLANDARPIRYLHVDCDLYSSTKTIFEHLGDRIVEGTVIVFDEYFNFSGWQECEYKAFQELVSERGLQYEYLTYNHEHQQVAVKITAHGGVS